MAVLLEGSLKRGGRHAVVCPIWA